MIKIVKYGANWCSPCKVLSKILKDSTYTYEEIDVDEFPELANEKKISTIPFIEFCKDDNIVKTHSGFISKEQLDTIMKEFEDYEE